ncbi:MAG: flagellar filament capping protein FliD [Planctomycetes bacterium]|nr:flagellar filament capping protein FliD [Planctomycetota bacterium]
MGTITTGTGLISGLDIASIVDSLMELEAAPRDLLEERQTELDEQRLSVIMVSTQLTMLRSSLVRLRTGNVLAAATATSSNSSILSATALNGAVPGTYQFTVGRTVSTQQMLSSGIADATSTALGAGTVTLQSAQARLTDDMNLDVLNGQEGVSRGRIRITDRSGASAIIDLSMAVSINDVIEAINSNDDIEVQASADGDHLVLTDLTGQSASNLIVTEVSGGTTAADLGIDGNVASATMTGANLISVNAATNLGVLNNSLGVGIQTGNDLHFTLQDGTEFNVDLSGVTTLGEVIDAINNASGNPGDLLAELNAAGDGLRLTDVSVGGGTLTVTSGNGGSAAFDLGILGSDTDSDGIVDGDALLGGLQDVLLSRLNGGSGVDRGSISITDRNGTTSVIDLSGAKTIQDVLAAINDPGMTADVTASLNNSGNGIIITDNTTGGGNLVIADVGGTTMAADLNIAVDAAVSESASGDLNRQFISVTTRLEDLNGGTGITTGTFRITDSNGLSSVIDLTQGNEVTLGDVITEINAALVDVTARINDTGDGIILEDTGGGGELLKVEDLSGTAAADLNIAGEAATGTTYIDGNSEVQLTIGATDTLEDLVDAINDAGLALRASVLNDGSATNPYRLSLSSEWSGAKGGWLVDLGELGLSLTEMVSGRDAVLRVGSGSTGDPVLITSNSNTVTGVIDKVTLDLMGASTSTPVTVTVTRDMSGTLEGLNEFVTQFNEVTSQLATLTEYDAETMEGAVLQGDGSIMSLQQSLYQMIFHKFEDVEGAYQTLSSLGFRISSGAQLSLDEDRFTQAFNSNPDDVLELLTDTTNGALKYMEDSLRVWTAPATGRLAIQADRLQTQSDTLGDRISAMDVLLEGKRERLTNNFIAMESALATLTSQQSAVENLAAAVESWRDSINSG